MGGMGGSARVTRPRRVLATVAAAALLALMVQGWISSFGHAATRPKPRAAAPPFDISPEIDLRMISSK
jgi:hypothetical protein